LKIFAWTIIFGSTSYMITDFQNY